MAARLAPLYGMLERIPSTRETARRLGLVTLDEMVSALISAIVSLPEGVRVIEVPEIRHIARRATSAAPVSTLRS